MKHLVLLPSGASTSSLQLRSSRSAAAAAPARPRRQHGAARHRHLAVAAAPADGPRRNAAGQNVQQNATVAGDATADAGSQPGAHGSTAAAGEQPAVQQAAPARSQRWRAMLLSCWRLLQRSLWPLVVAHGVTDALVFLLHRLSHRATNEGERWQFATQIAGVPTVLGLAGPQLARCRSRLFTLLPKAHHVSPACSPRSCGAAAGGRPFDPCSHRQHVVAQHRPCYSKLQDGWACAASQLPGTSQLHTEVAGHALLLYL